MPAVTSVVVGAAIAGRYSFDGVSRLHPGTNVGVSLARSSGSGTCSSRCFVAIRRMNFVRIGFLMSGGTRMNSLDQ